MPWLAPIGTPADERPDREPGADLAIHPRVEIAGRRPSPAAAPAPASKVLSAPGRRRKDGPRASRGLRRNDRRRGSRSTATAIPACAGRSRDRGSRRAASQPMTQHSLTLVCSLVTPAIAAEFAAGDRRRHADLAHGRRLHRRRARPCGPDPVDVLDGRILLARQSCTALAPSVIEPPPTVTMRSALAARACSVAAITAARGVCAGIASKVATQRGPSASRISRSRRFRG